MYNCVFGLISALTYLIMLHKPVCAYLPHELHCPTMKSHKIFNTSIGVSNDQICVL